MRPREELGGAGSPKIMTIGVTIFPGSKGTRPKNEASIHAWRLMSDHVHLLPTCELANLTVMMRALSTAYAQHFNGRHGRIDSVFQGRFTSIPTEGESHLLEAVRYIHPNPQAAGMDAVDSFPWSSCREHVSSQNLDHVPLYDTSLIPGMLDDPVGFHQAKELEIEILDLVPARPIRSDAELTAIASELFGQAYADPIASLSKAERNATFKQLHARGASIRQLERLTGIDRGAIQAAVKERW